MREDSFLTSVEWFEGFFGVNFFLSLSSRQYRLELKAIDMVHFSQFLGGNIRIDGLD